MEEKRENRKIEIKEDKKRENIRKTRHAKKRNASETRPYNLNKLEKKMEWERDEITRDKRMK